MLIGYVNLFSTRLIDILWTNGCISRLDS